MATLDGNYSSYPVIDWAVTFAEAPTVATTAETIGIRPEVVTVVSCYDGGKAMAGWARYDGMIMFGWVVKMWGSTGTINCGTGSVVTGYVDMI
jgi:hypothetical protein